MNEMIFWVVPDTDKGYFEAFGALTEGGGFAPTKATFGDIPEISIHDLPTHSGLKEVLGKDVKAFRRITYYYGLHESIRVERQPDASSLYDKVTVSAGNQKDAVQFAMFCAAAQKHLGASSLSNLSNLLGPEAQRHFEAREIALSKLEKLTATLLQDVEKSRQEREREFHVKETSLEEKYEQRLAELDSQHEFQQKAIADRAEELDTLQKELDDRAAKHARRQHYKDIKEKFKSWSETFQVTEGTKNLRGTIYWFTLFLTLLFGGLAGLFLFQSFSLQDSTQVVAVIIKQVTFTILFVSSAYSFIKWNNQWFQRHANEEFRLKRMELDIDRASWFVEMAFEWKDQKGEEIPIELVERLTHGLFSEEKTNHPVEPSDSLAQALMGAARFKVKLADGTEAEYDRKGIEKLIRKSSKSNAD
jgi:hypothetical protein